MREASLFPRYAEPGSGKDDLAPVYEKEWRKKYEGRGKKVNEILAPGARADVTAVCGIGIMCGAALFRLPGTHGASLYIGATGGGRSGFRPPQADL
jgi:hypothetical protein